MHTALPQEPSAGLHPSRAALLSRRPHAAVMAQARRTPVLPSLGMQPLCRLAASLLPRASQGLPEGEAGPLRRVLSLFVQPIEREHLRRCFAPCR